MKLVRCDRCKKEVTASNAATYMNVNTKQYSFDLCTECRLELGVWLKGMNELK